MLLHNNEFMWLTVVEGPAKPAQHSNVTLRVLGGAQQRCLCFQGVGREQSASLDLQGDGFGVDTLPWCWALPQASHTCRMWFLIEQSWLPSQDRGVSSLEHLSQQRRPLLEVPVRKTPLVQLGEVVWLLLLPKNPSAAQGGLARAAGNEPSSHTHPSLPGQQPSWILPPVG